MFRQLRDYTPALTGLLLIAAGLCLPLGVVPGSPRLIDFVSAWATQLLHTF